MDQKKRELPIQRTQRVVCFSSLVLLAITFVVFRYVASSARDSTTKSIEGFLRNEYLAANTYALSKSLTDLENLGVVRCVTLIEDLETERVFYETASPVRCFSHRLLKWFLQDSFEMEAVNGLTYSLTYQASVNWAVLFLELSLYLVIVVVTLLFLKQLREQMSRVSVAEALISLSRQVSHDIRSPLSALNMVVGGLDHLPNEKRVVIRNAVHRINDIANQLLKKTYTKSPQISVVTQEPSAESSKVMLTSLMDSIVSEKRVEYRKNRRLTIEYDVSNGFGLFAAASAIEVSRAISNMVNNAVEACDGEGTVCIALERHNKLAAISVKDTGKGIPPDILDRLGERGFSHGKGGASGSGLGLYHARRVAEAAGGALKVWSCPEAKGLRTSVELSLEIVEAPEWFAPSLKVDHKECIVSMDDDESIHQIWEARVKKDTKRWLSHRGFLSVAEFVKYLSCSKKEECFYLIDHELIGESLNGLDLIEQYDLAKSSVLVTSRYDEAAIQTRACELGVKILPKELASQIPLEFSGESQTFYDAVVIDDDRELIHPLWEMEAEAQGKSVRCFSSPDDFFAIAEQIDTKSPIFVDVHLGEGIDGLAIAERVLALGFRNVYVATGDRCLKTEDLPSGIRKVVGKSPHFADVQIDM